MERIVFVPDVLEKIGCTVSKGSVPRYRTFPLPSGTEARALQSFLSARGYPLGRIDGIAGPRTTRALQTFLREKVDATVQIDGVWGPQTARAYAESIAETLGISDPAKGRVRLVMHTSALRKSDFYTFEREAMRLASDYQQHFPR